MESKEKQIEDHIRSVLELLGEDTTREGLLETPRRVASMWLELTEGNRSFPPEMTSFDRGQNDQMITLFNVDFSSSCEHHMVTFNGKAHIGYIPDKRIVGLSKLARVVEWFARRLQIQERMTAEIADFLMARIEPQGVIVLIEAHHLCMSMRGIKKPNHTTVTSAIRGQLDKSEFFDLYKALS